ncbi:MAG: amino acid ABC transporter permease [Firmicutes bacterium]|nr:amino acid ABC transporter permease [Bacillota bacterium]
MGTTLLITFSAVVIGVLVGLLLALMRLSKVAPLRWLAVVYIEIIRGMPMMVQALLLYSGLPMIINTLWPGVGFRWDEPIVCGILVCGINSSAYVAEVIRSGLQAVDHGQMEAARSLGMTNGQTYRYIIIPQAFRIILPALGNEFVTLLKETSVLSAITVVEVTRKGMLWVSATFNAWPAYIGVAIAYLCITIPAGRLVAYVERRMSRSDRSK